MKQNAGIAIIIAAVLIAVTALSMTGCITIELGPDTSQSGASQSDTIQQGNTASGAQQVTSQRITTSQSGTVVDPSVYVPRILRSIT